VGKVEQDFYPPRRKLPLVRLAQFLAPTWAFVTQRIWLEADYDSLRILSELRRDRVLLLPNHPTFQDPVVSFLLSGVTGESFYFLSAIELFNSALAPFFQGIGVYSIRRGLSDRASIAQTIDLLTQPECHLVIFPEGGCSFQNDTVMPFRAGGVQLAFQALNRSAKQGEPIPDLYVVPVAIKYFYRRDMTPVIKRTMAQLERSLGITPAKADNYQRLRAIAQKVLVKVEQDYGMHSPDVESKSWNERIERLREQVLAHCERALGLPINSAEALRERTYRIEYALKQRADALESAESTETDATSESLRKYRLLEKSVKRLLNFDAIYDGYVAENPTPERFLDTLVRLEREVFDIDQPPPKSFRKAVLKAGEPINLKDWFEQYRSDRGKTVNDLTLKIQQAVQMNLDLLNQS